MIFITCQSFTKPLLDQNASRHCWSFSFLDELYGLNHWHQFQWRNALVKAQLTMMMIWFWKNDTAICNFHETLHKIVLSLMRFWHNAFFCGWIRRCMILWGRRMPAFRQEHNVTILSLAAAAPAAVLSPSEKPAAPDARIHTRGSFHVLVARRAGFPAACFSAASW